MPDPKYTRECVLCEERDSDKTRYTHHMIPPNNWGKTKRRWCKVGLCYDCHKRKEGRRAKKEFLGDVG